MFLIGHPKSGNTWSAYMLAILVNRDFEGAINLANIGTYVPAIHSRDHQLALHEAEADPRIFRNEWPVHPELYPRVIYLVRDPRSVLVSYYHMYGNITGDRTLSLAEFVREYLAEGSIRRLELTLRWDVQVRPWSKRADRGSDTILVRYEDMLEDRDAALRRMAAFIGLDVPEEVMRLAVGRGDFDVMKRSEKEHGVESYLQVERPRVSFIRRGRTDSWKDEMDSDTVRLVERELGSTMVAMGYSLAAERRDGGSKLRQPRRDRGLPRTRRS